MRKSQRDLRVLWKAANKFSFPSFILFLSLTFLITASAYAAVTIVISYTDEDVGDREPYLKIYYKDTSGHWIEAQNQEPHPDQNYVKADIPQFELETVLASFPPPPTAWRILTVSPVRSCPMAIRYDVVISSPITIKLFNAGGQQIQTILSDSRDAGHYGIAYDCGWLSNGVYYLGMYSNGGLVYTFTFAMVR